MILVELLQLWMWIAKRCHLQWARILVSSNRSVPSPYDLACGGRVFSLHCSVMVGDPTMGVGVCFEGGL